MLKSHTDLATLDLNLLYTFQVFVETGTVLATAKHMARSQPAISARLHQLETELGTKLLVPSGRTLALTPFGRKFSERIAGLFVDIQGLVDQARSADTAFAGTLRIGALPTVGVYILAPSAAAFVQAYPDAQIEYHYGLVPDGLAKLRSGLLDLVVGVGEVTDQDLDIAQIGIVRPMLVSKKGQVFPQKKLRPKHLAEFSWVGFGRIGDGFFDEVWDFLIRHKLDTRVQVRASHIQTLKALVRDGAGVTILPDYTVVEPDLACREVQGLSFMQPIWVAARPRSLSIPLVSAFRATLL